MSQDRGLIIRHAQRHEIALPCELVMAVAHESAVRLSAKVSLVNGRVGATLVDASAGGLGVLSEVFFPKQSLVDLRVLRAGDSSASPIFETTLRVKRVVMTDRQPTYLIGLSFEHHDEPSMRRVQEFLASLEGVARA